jgi:hypothetical protein
MYSVWRVMVLSLLVSIAPALAHEVRPVVVTADLSRSDQVVMTLSANLEALMAGIGPQHKDTDEAPEAALYNRLRALSEPELRARFASFAPEFLRAVAISVDGLPGTLQVMGIDIPDVKDAKLARISTVTLSAPIGPAAKQVRWTFPAVLGSSVLRVKRTEGTPLETNWLKEGAVSADIPLIAAPPKGRIATLVEYAAMGFTHILPKGLDHILFVLGLFFLSPKLRPLLVQVTAFTIAHSITLALGLYGVVDVSPKIVEPLIALSIVYVAVENLLTPTLKPWRPLVVFAFGLLHGLGFAGILQELGLPRDQYVTALVGFNVGVELGQLAVIALAFFATAYWFRDRSWYRGRIVQPASLLIAAAGLFWTVERIWFA